MVLPLLYKGIFDAKVFIHNFSGWSRNWIRICILISLVIPMLLLLLILFIGSVVDLPTMTFYNINPLISMPGFFPLFPLPSLVFFNISQPPQSEDTVAEVDVSISVCATGWSSIIKIVIIQYPFETTFPCLTWWINFYHKQGFQSISHHHWYYHFKK